MKIVAFDQTQELADLVGLGFSSLWLKVHELRHFRPSESLMAALHSNLHKAESGYEVDEVIEGHVLDMTPHQPVEKFASLQASRSFTSLAKARFRRDYKENRVGLFAQIPVCKEGPLRRREWGARNGSPLRSRRCPGRSPRRDPYRFSELKPLADRGCLDPLASHDRFAKSNFRVDQDEPGGLSRLVSGHGRELRSKTRLTPFDSLEVCLEDFWHCFLSSPTDVDQLPQVFQEEIALGDPELIAAK
jgi:hypothetical protein